MKIIFTRIDFFAIKDAFTRSAGKKVSWCRTATKHFKQSKYRFAQLLSSSSSDTPPLREKELCTHICTHTNSLVRSHTGCHSRRPESFNPTDRRRSICPNLNTYTHKSYARGTSCICSLCSTSWEVAKNWSSVCINLIICKVLYWVIPHLGCIMRAWTADRFLRYAKWEEYLHGQFCGRTSSAFLNSRALCFGRSPQNRFVFVVNWRLAIAFGLSMTWFFIFVHWQTKTTPAHILT
jgi:hypothetical protein